MRLVDLTAPVPERENMRPPVTADPWGIHGPDYEYTGMVYHFNHWSMSGSYIDFPGHIKELDDGLTAANYPLDKLYEVPAVVIHIDRSNQPGKVTTSDLEAACPCPVNGGALIVHALGTKRFDEVAERSVSFSSDAVSWIIDKGIHLLVSDIYEDAKEPVNIFWKLFGAGISTVCSPINMEKLDTPAVKLTVLFPLYPHATQLPCRIIARMDD